MGGEEAPEGPEEGAKRILECAALPFSETGGFWRGNKRLDF